MANNNPIDQIFKKAEEYQPPYDIGVWESVEKKLTKPSRGGMLHPGFWISGALLLITACIILYYSEFSATSVQGVKYVSTHNLIKAEKPVSVIETKSFSSEDIIPATTTTNTRTIQKQNPVNVSGTSVQVKTKVNEPKTLKATEPVTYTSEPKEVAENTTESTTQPKQEKGSSVASNNNANEFAENLQTEEAANSNKHIELYSEETIDSVVLPEPQFINSVAVSNNTEATDSIDDFDLGFDPVQPKETKGKGLKRGIKKSGIFFRNMGRSIADFPWQKPWPEKSEPYMKETIENYSTNSANTGARGNMNIYYNHAIMQVFEPDMKGKKTPLVLNGGFDKPIGKYHQWGVGLRYKHSYSGTYYAKKFNSICLDFAHHTNFQNSLRISAGLGLEFSSSSIDNIQLPSTGFQPYEPIPEDPWYKLSLNPGISISHEDFFVSVQGSQFWIPIHGESFEMDYGPRLALASAYTLYWTPNVSSHIVLEGHNQKNRIFVSPGTIVDIRSRYGFGVFYEELLYPELQASINLYNHLVAFGSASFYVKDWESLGPVYKMQWGLRLGIGKKKHW